LFYNFTSGTQVKEIKVSGRIKIEKEILKDKDDSYIQIGLIYKGDYRPSGFVRYFLPEWLKILLKNAKDQGLDKVTFYGASFNPKKELRVQNVRDIKLEFMPEQKIIDDGSFELSIQPVKFENVIGLWIRSDGDDSKAKFTTTIKSITITL
jgi:hypothetical protein